MPIDLHAHTTHSDGTLTPAELVRLAWQRGLSALAVTDHDTTAGLPEAHRVGAAVGVEILDGCEVTARLPAGIVHILAYGFEPDDGDFEAMLVEVRRGRDERNALILAKLTALGVPVSERDVSRHVEGSITARPHIAAALVDQGHADDLQAAFRLYLHDGGPAYTQAQVPTAEAVVATVVAAGGVAVLAHPRSLGVRNRRAYRQVFAGLKEEGLAGIEVHHPSHGVEQRRMFQELADELDLVASGGSDFHGANKPYLELGTGDGSIEVDYAVWDALRARRSGAA